MTRHGTSGSRASETTASTNTMATIASTYHGQSEASGDPPTPAEANTTAGPTACQLLASAPAAARETLMRRWATRTALAIKKPSATAAGTQPTGNVNNIGTSTSTVGV